LASTMPKHHVNARNVLKRNRMILPPDLLN